MSERTGPAIEVENLRHAFKGHQALKSASFRVEEGSIHGFVGPNGAGKTTSLKVLSTLLIPDGGTARIFGRDVVKEADLVRRRIGFMPDHFSMYRQMTVFEYLDFFAAAYGLGLKERNRTVADVLALTDMDGRQGDLIKGLSRGMQQRVSLARVLVHDPALLLLDEPASGLDPRARIELMEILRELRSMGKTIFISSHILSELADLCDSCTLLDVGQVKYCGSMQDLLTEQGEEGRHVLELAAEHADIASVIGGVAGVVEAEAGDDPLRIRFRYRRDECDLNAVLAAVIAAGAEVLEFRQDRRHLNEAFMDLTTAGVRT